MKKHNPKILNLAEKIGSFIEYWGFKEVHGKVWTLMFLAPEPIDANYLRYHLGISKALASMTIKDLLSYNVILEVEKEKPGTQKYEINSNITKVILDVIKNRELQMLLEITASHKTLKQDLDKKEDLTVSKERLEKLGDMVDSASILLDGMTSGSLVDFNMFDEVTDLS